MTYHQLNFPHQLTGKILKASVAIYGRRFGMMKMPRNMVEVVRIKMALMFLGRIFSTPVRFAGCSVKGKIATQIK
ncbi:hypothetical protein APS14_27375 [Pseudomonas thivervalensis]|nr:hypothetical protein APS14_27375 [Pseudomonas thivervalensis]